ncbi:GNAT family N-acetyltransferase [Bradyrhizobium ottawaense]|uniref:GNAT family N-acetyltransferase n=1 Tax=Bradyrhizobium ottawaense TaxID=931866 RepID=UPI0027D4A4DF|nr:GNAT family protein [Bradyrhizobium ottawaense]GMO70940.1 GNAT family protein [Bradyrhizobium ottawaense]
MEQHSISTPRLRLRTLFPADCSERYVSWLNQPEINRYLETRFGPPHTLESVRNYVSAVAERSDEHLFGIFLDGGVRHIGNIKVGPISSPHRVGDVGLLIGERDCWGRGIATEAIEAVCRYAFAQLRVRKLSAGMYAPNRGSTRAFEKVGWRHEGIRRDHFLLDDKPCDLVILGLRPSDLPG